MNHFTEITNGAARTQQVSEIPPEWDRISFAPEDAAGYMANEEPNYADDGSGSTGIVAEDVGDLAVVLDIDAPDEPGEAPMLEPGASPPPDEPGIPHVDDDPPTDIPRIKRAEGDPSRGQALKELIAYATRVSTDIETRTSASVVEQTGDAAIEAVMARDDVSREDAISHIGIEPARDDEGALITDEYGIPTTIRSEVTAAELDDAEPLYYSRLQAAGLRLHDDGMSIVLEMDDPDRFTAAVSQLPPAENAEEQATFNEQMEQIITHVVVEASTTIINDDPGAARNMLRFAPLETRESVIGAYPETPTRQKRHFAASLAENAGALAEHLQDHDTPMPFVDAMRQLYIAQAEGNMAEWAVGARLGILGWGHSVIALDHLKYRSEWEPVYSFAEHLVSIRPDDRITTVVRDTLFTNIDNALTGQRIYDDRSDPAAVARRDQAYDNARQFLEEAKNRLWQIFYDREVYFDMDEY